MEIVILALLFTKHLIVDFPLQTPYQWMNKGTYGHLGGITHAVLHGAGTWLCLVWFAPAAAIYLSLMDAVIHYHIDWVKMNVNAKYGWKADTHPEFWILLGIDQWLHAMTYLLLVVLL